MESVALKIIPLFFLGDDSVSAILRDELLSSNGGDEERNSHEAKTVDHKEQQKKETWKYYDKDNKLQLIIKQDKDGNLEVRDKSNIKTLGKIKTKKDGRIEVLDKDNKLIGYIKQE